MTESQYITTSHKYQMRMSRSPVKSNCAVMLEYVTRVPMETTLSVYWGQCPLTNHGMHAKEILFLFFADNSRTCKY